MISCACTGKLESKMIKIKSSAFFKTILGATSYVINFICGEILANYLTIFNDYFAGKE